MTPQALRRTAMTLGDISQLQYRGLEPQVTQASKRSAVRPPLNVGSRAFPASPN
jgi:hypothetical protein